MKIDLNQELLPLDDGDKIGFGKYAHLPMKQVPADYLIWCYDQTWFAAKYPRAYAYVAKHYKWIEKEADQLVNNREMDPSWRDNNE